MALWIFGVERLVQGEVLLLQRENLNVVGIREDCVKRTHSSAQPPFSAFPFPSLPKPTNKKTTEDRKPST